MPLDYMGIGEWLRAVWRAWSTRLALYEVHGKYDAVGRAFLGEDWEPGMRADDLIEALHDRLEKQYEAGHGDGEMHAIDGYARGGVVSEVPDLRLGEVDPRLWGGGHE